MSLFRRFEARGCRQESDGEYGLGMSVYGGPFYDGVGRTLTLRVFVGPWLFWIGWVVRRRLSPRRRRLEVP